MPTFGSLFRDLGGDVRRLPSRGAAVIAGVAGALSLSVRPEDLDVTRRANASGRLDAAFAPGAALGGGLVQFGAAFSTYLVGRSTGNAGVARLGADLVRAQIVNTALTQTLKVSIRRQRPDGGRYSFPSGHTSGTFATATVLQRHYGWKAGVPAYALATYVGASRLQKNKHFMSDVIFGAGVGIISGRAVTVGHGRTRFALTPVAASGGAGLGLTLVQPR
ncbi:MAG: phosphatase PAP2 family protein [Vicinamibacteraceae bacterium]